MNTEREFAISIRESFLNDNLKPLNLKVSFDLNRDAEFTVTILPQFSLEAKGVYLATQIENIIRDAVSNGLLPAEALKSVTARIEYPQKAYVKLTHIFSSKVVGFMNLVPLFENVRKEQPPLRA